MDTGEIAEGPTVSWVKFVWREIKFAFWRSEEVNRLVYVEFDSVFEVETLTRTEAPCGENRVRGSELGHGKLRNGC